MFFLLGKGNVALGNVGGQVWENVRFTLQMMKKFKNRYGPILILVSLSQ